MDAKKEMVLPYCYNVTGERCIVCRQCGFYGCKNKGLKYKKNG